MSKTQGSGRDGAGISSGWLAAVPFEMRTVGALLERSAKAEPDRVLFTWERQDYTLSDVDTQVDVLVRRLRAGGVQRGSRVGLLMNTSPEYLYAWFALAKIGAVEVPINTAYRGELLHHQLEQAHVTLVIADAGVLHESVAAVRDRLPQVEDVLVQPGTFSELLVDDGSGSTVEALPGPDEVACVLYTSGTTGPSKGVLLTHHHEASFGHFFAEITGLRSDDVILNYSPFFHISGKFTTIACLLTGARMVLRARLSIERFWSEVNEHGITAFVAIGGVCHMLHGQPRRADDADNSVRVVYAVPAPAEIYHDFESRFGLKLVETYGATETNLVVNSSLDESQPGACGRPNPIFDVELVDGDDVPVADGEPGELVVRCGDPLLLSAGYDGLAAATQDAWRNGWFHTGDRAVRDKTGMIWFKDRVKDSIRRRGENISSYEVERLVNSHPGIAESAAVGAPSELGEDEVYVVVVLNDDTELKPEELFFQFADYIPYHMVPRFIEIMDELPRTPTDKIEKYKLRADGPGSRTWDAERAGWRMTRTGVVPAENRTIVHESE